MAEMIKCERCDNLADWVNVPGNITQRTDYLCKSCFQDEYNIDVDKVEDVNIVLLVDGDIYGHSIAERFVLAYGLKNKHVVYPEDKRKTVASAYSVIVRQARTGLVPDGYWEAWQDIEDNVLLVDDNGQRYFLTIADGNIWGIDKDAYEALTPEETEYFWELKFGYH